MKKCNYLTVIAVVATGAAALLSGCSDTRTATSPTPANNNELQMASSQQPFDPTVTPPPAAPGSNDCVLNPDPAPIPAPTPAVVHHRHRYLHIELRDNQPYLADNYGNTYATGRDNDGDLYPVYQDPVTDAVYPLYYDDERDNYYRCVDYDNNGYYRNYCGDPGDVYYEGDPDQQEECQSDDCQPFIVNYGVQYSSWNGYDPQYAYWNGPHYSRHTSVFVSLLPVIVAAYIVFDTNDDNNGYGYNNWHNHGYNPVVINNHYYYQNTVIVNNYGSNGQGGRRVAARPGPPLGHFQGFDPRRQPTNFQTAHVAPPERLNGYNRFAQNRPASTSQYGPTRNVLEIAGAPRSAGQAGGGNARMYTGADQAMQHEDTKRQAIARQAPTGQRMANTNSGRHAAYRTASSGKQTQYKVSSAAPKHSSSYASRPSENRPTSQHRFVAQTIGSRRPERTATAPNPQVRAGQHPLTEPKRMMTASNSGVRRERQAQPARRTVEAYVPRQRQPVVHHYSQPAQRQEQAYVPREQAEVQRAVPAQHYQFYKAPAARQQPQFTQRTQPTMRRQSFSQPSRPPARMSAPGGPTRQGGGHDSRQRHQ